MQLLGFVATNSTRTASMEAGIRAETTVIQLKLDCVKQDLLHEEVAGGLLVVVVP